MNRDIVILKSALSKAVEWEMITENPLLKLKLLKIDVLGRIRYLLAEEENRFYKVLFQRDEELKLKRQMANLWRDNRGYERKSNLMQFEFADYLLPMVITSINTGLRQNELFSLKWSAVNLDLALLTVTGTTAKSSKTRHIPLNPLVLQTLRDWRAMTSSSDLIFPSPVTGGMFTDVKKVWGNILKKADIENFHWHDMRHHFASKLVMAGVDLNTVRELLGHSDIKMTLRYAHLAPEHKASAVARLANSHCRKQLIQELV